MQFLFFVLVYYTIRLYFNLFLLLQIAPFLLLGTEYGHLITIWRLCAIGEDVMNSIMFSIIIYLYFSSDNAYLAKLLNVPMSRIFCQFQFPKALFLLLRSDKPARYNSSLLLTFVGCSTFAFYTKIKFNIEAECLKLRLLDIWSVCTHKKIVVALVLITFWNLSTIKTRIFTGNSLVSHLFT